jgi:hypothetical protein
MESLIILQEDPFNIVWPVSSDSTLTQPEQ